MSARFAIIVAGGRGSRMMSDEPKQFLPLAGVPILMHTMKAFHHFDNAIQIIVVLPENGINRWKELCHTHSFKIPHTIVPGGETRFHSVKAGLDAINSENGVAGIHDAVRPLVSKKTISLCYSSAEKTGSAVPCLPVKDSLRRKTNGGTISCNRENFLTVQTPQCFQLNIIKPAYQQSYIPGFTDDASVVEVFGHPVSVVEGNEENIKITTPADLHFAESLFPHL